MPPAKDKTVPKMGSLLVVHQGALGDFILALPVLQTLREAFPEARSALLGYPRILELVQNRFYADEIFSIDQKGMATFFVKGGALDPFLSAFFEGYDLTVVFGRDGGGNLVENLRRISRGRILPINSFPPWDGKTHLTDHLLGELEAHGFSHSEKRPKLFLDEADRVWGRDFWREKGLDPRDRSKVAVLHPGSGSRKKVWPGDRFMDLAHHIQEDLGLRILVVLGPAEEEEIQKAFDKEPKGMFFLARGLSVLQLASAMEGCRFFVGNDSGISHLAAALGLPTLSIFGPTDPRVWSPRGENVRVVRRKIPCSPCPQERFFLCKDTVCLKEIEMEEVVKGLEKMGVWRSPPRKEEQNGRQENW